MRFWKALAFLIVFMFYNKKMLLFKIRRTFYLKAVGRLLQKLKKV